MPFEILRQQHFRSFRKLIRWGFVYFRAMETPTAHFTFLFLNDSKADAEAFGNAIR
jgi:hypothetical protein